MAEDVAPQDYHGLLPEKAVPVWGFRLVEWLDEDGTPQMGWVVDGSVMMTEVAGALFSAAIDNRVKVSGSD